MKRKIIPETSNVNKAPPSYPMEELEGNIVVVERIPNLDPIY